MQSVCSPDTQTTGGRKASAKNLKAVPASAEGGEDVAAEDPSRDGAKAGAGPDEDAVATAVATVAAKEKKGRSKGDSLYYRVKCRDNGVGMPHAKVT